MEKFTVFYIGLINGNTPWPKSLSIIADVQRGRWKGEQARHLPHSGFLERIKIEKGIKYIKYQYQKLKEF
jgi:hypothetical protein